MIVMTRRLKMRPMLLDGLWPWENDIDEFDVDDFE
jgi:hypothetical protein